MREAPVRGALFFPGHSSGSGVWQLWNLFRISLLNPEGEAGFKTVTMQEAAGWRVSLA